MFYRIAKIRPEEDGRFRLTIKWYDGVFGKGHIHSNNIIVDRLEEVLVDNALVAYAPTAKERIDANTNLVIPEFLKDRLIKIDNQHNVGVRDTPTPVSP